MKNKLTSQQEDKAASRLVKLFCAYIKTDMKHRFEPTYRGTTGYTETQALVPK